MERSEDLILTDLLPLSPYRHSSPKLSVYISNADEHTELPQAKPLPSKRVMCQRENTANNLEALERFLYS